MRRVGVIVGSAITTLCFFATPVFATTTVSGTISSDTTWTNQVYEVTGNVTVNSGVTLTVDPGAIIKFDSNTKLTVSGTLDAEGTATSTIYFTSIKDDSVGGDTNGDGWDTSLATWNAEGPVLFATDTVPLIDTLVVSTTSLSDVAFEAEWSSDGTPPDSVILNGYYMSQDSENGRINAITHELGHALGLGHSYPGNIMNYIITGQTTLGDQDKIDDHYLWGY